MFNKVSANAELTNTETLFLRDTQGEVPECLQLQLQHLINMQPCFTRADSLTLNSGPTAFNSYLNEDYLTSVIFSVRHTAAFLHLRNSDSTLLGAILNSEITNKKNKK